ncbi:hypothetical protein [Streptomyces sp. WZ-12]|uniref:hypothetical protein n=1 Tax=Streptomyces sp. WZ-12 TaxID=3030210 RepID=UPI0023817531|nr:hypothetical protein [Streptomyces sp. WZ-12]
MPGRSSLNHPEKRLYLAGVALMVLFVILAFDWLFAVVTAVLLACMFLVVNAAGRGFSALHARQRRTGWLMLALVTAPVSLLALPVSYFVGLFSGGLDVAESCRLIHHEDYDAAYRSEHAAEMDRWFPLHNKCNSDFDLVPTWVNPALVFFAALLAASIITPIVAAVSHLRATRGRKSGQAPA